MLQSQWKRLRFYTCFRWRFMVLRKVEQLIYGIVITEARNLACRGFREVYFTGGEPGA